VGCLFLVFVVVCVQSVSLVRGSWCSDSCSFSDEHSEHARDPGVYLFRNQVRLVTEFRPLLNRPLPVIRNTNQLELRYYSVHTGSPVSVRPLGNKRTFLSLGAPQKKRQKSGKI
jgi:hypothetical protein